MLIHKTLPPSRCFHYFFLSLGNANRNLFLLKIGFAQELPDVPRGLWHFSTISPSPSFIWEMRSASASSNRSRRPGFDIAPPPTCCLSSGDQTLSQAWKVSRIIRPRKYHTICSGHREFMATATRYCCQGTKMMKRTMAKHQTIACIDHCRTWIKPDMLDHIITRLHHCHGQNHWLRT